MERIREAVEQARRERSAGGGQQPAAPKARETERLDRSKPKEPGGSRVEYTETRTVEILPSTLEDHRLVAAIPGHPQQDVYRMLRTRVLQELSANNWNTIAVTSPAPGAGKTLTAINLAISIARDKSRTALLVDADLRHPKVSRYFDFSPEMGLNDWLDGDLPLSKVLFHPNLDRLTVLPGREPIDESAETLASPKFAGLMQDIRSRYKDRVLVLDIAPVLSVDDALAIIPNVDCMLMVAEAGVTEADDLSRALELLDGVPVIGTVLNKVEKRRVHTY